jgi:hypothetical protein
MIYGTFETLKDNQRYSRNSKTRINRIKSDLEIWFDEQCKVASHKNLIIQQLF